MVYYEQLFMEVEMKIFISDLDGTLLNSNHTLDDATRDYIIELRKEGHIFGVATGRPFDSASKVVPNMHQLFDFGIYNNGANFVDFKDGEAHDQHPLERSTIEAILDVYADMGANPIIFKNGIMYTHSQDPYHDSLIDSGFVIEYGDVRQHLEDTHEKIIFSVDVETRNRVLEHYKDNPHDDYVAFMSQAELVEFMDPRINKWVGVEYFIDKYKLGHLDTIAFGDNGNDLELIQGATMGVAMENAIESLLNAATHIAPHNDKLGVITFIQNYLNKD